MVMGATNKILAQQVDELTEGLTDVRECVQEVKEAEDMAELSDTTAEIVENIDKSSGLKTMTKMTGKGPLKDLRKLRGRVPRRKCGGQSRVVAPGVFITKVCQA